MVHNTARPSPDKNTFTFLYPFQVSFPQAPSGGLIIGPFEVWIYQGGKQHIRVEESLDVLLNDHSTCFQDPHAAPPWSWHVK